MKKAIHNSILKTLSLGIFIAISLFSHQNLHAASSSNLKELTYTNDLIKHLSRERGMTTMFITNATDEIKRSLKEQRSFVDNAANTYIKFLKTQNSTYVGTLEKSINDIKTVRKSVDAHQKISLNDYDALERQLVGQCNAFAKTIDSKLLSHYKLYSAFLNAKIATDLLRDTITPKLSTHQPINTNVLNELIKKSKTPTYDTLNDKKTKASLDKILKNEDLQECSEDLAFDLKAITKAAKSGSYTTEPMMFFVMLSEQGTALEQAMKIVFEAMQRG